MIDGRTCRAARGFLAWTSRHLATRSGVPVSRIFEFERDRPIDAAYRACLEATFLRHGVAVILDGEEAAGIRAVAAEAPARAPGPGAAGS